MCWMVLVRDAGCRQLTYAHWIMTHLVIWVFIYRKSLGRCDGPNRGYDRCVSRHPILRDRGRDWLGLADHGRIGYNLWDNRITCAKRVVCWWNVIVDPISYNLASGIDQICVSHPWMLGKLILSRWRRWGGCIGMIPSHCYGIDR